MSVYLLPVEAQNVLKEGLHPSISDLVFTVGVDGNTVVLKEDVEASESYTPKVVEFTVSDEDLEQFKGKDRVTFKTKDWSLVYPKPKKDKSMVSDIRKTGCSLGKFNFANKY